MNHHLGHGARADYLFLFVFGFIFARPGFCLGFALVTFAFSCFLAPILLIRRIRLAGWGTVVCGIEPFALKDNANRLIHLVESGFTAFRADDQMVIREFLVLIEADSAFFTLIRIRRHNLLPDFLSNRL